MKMRSLVLAGVVTLATVTAAAAQTQSAANSNDQVAKVHDQTTTRSDWFISPNDPRYQENGAPRVGEEPVFSAPYAPIQGGGPGGGGHG